MPEITIQKLEPGMVLARDAVHVNGRVLLEAGTIIAPKHLRMLKAWGVFSVVVDGAGNEPQANDHPAVDAEAERYRANWEALAPHFRHADMSHPVIAELFRFRLRKTL